MENFKIILYEVIHNFQTLSSVNRMGEVGQEVLGGNVACMGDNRNSYKLLVGRT
jgi:hypothetical protein